VGDAERFQTLHRVPTFVQKHGGSERECAIEDVDARLRLAEDAVPRADAKYLPLSEECVKDESGGRLDDWARPLVVFGRGQQEWFLALE
jgi:hypothetical protein